MKRMLPSRVGVEMLPVMLLSIERLPPNNLPWALPFLLLALAGSW